MPGSFHLVSLAFSQLIAEIPKSLLRAYAIQRRRVRLSTIVRLRCLFRIAGCQSGQVSSFSLGCMELRYLINHSLIQRHVRLILATVVVVVVAPGFTELALLAFHLFQHFADYH